MVLNMFTVVTATSLYCDRQCCLDGSQLYTPWAI